MEHIDPCLIEDYKSNVNLLLQQKGSKLASAVILEKQLKRREVYTAIKPFTATKVDVSTLANSDTPTSAANTVTRVIDMNTYEWGDLLFRENRLDSLGDPTSKYTINAAYALGRMQDKIICNAMTADASQMGKDGAITTVGLQTVNKVVHGGKGLTLDKLRAARKILDDNDVDADEPQFIAVSGSDMSDLLKSVSQSALDYPSIQALVEKSGNSYLGFIFKRLSKSILTNTTTNKKYAIVWVKSAIVMGIGKDIQVDVRIRPDKRNAVQVYAFMECGAVRLDEKKVVLIELN